jgi:hypothetical protein
MDTSMQGSIQIHVDSVASERKRREKKRRERKRRERKRRERKRRERKRREKLSFIYGFPERDVPRYEGS